MDLNEFLTIDTNTTLDDLDIMSNELDILILLCRKTYSLKKLGIKNDQYKTELLNFIQADSRRINMDEFIMENNKISLIAYNANKLFFSNNTLESKLFNVLFFYNDNYWNQEKRDLAKEKIKIIDAKLGLLDRLRLELFFA
jgi:hypothetical protein